MKRIKFGEEFNQPDLGESGSESEIVPEPDSLDDSEFVVKTPDEAYFTFHNTAPEPEICRFTIPMDLKNLEGITVMQYLRTCTRISPPRMQLYDKTFHSWSHGSIISRENFLSALREIVVCAVPDGCDRLIFDLVGLDAEQEVNMDQETFELICAAAERTIFAKLLKQNQVPIPAKQLLEMVDFQHFRRNYNSLKLTPELDRFFDLLIS